MSTEENKAVARRYWEELHRGKGVGFGLGEDLFAPNYRHYLKLVCKRDSDVSHGQQYYLFD